MLKIQSDRVIIDGHEPTKEQCETMTLLANALAESESFKTVKYESGYAEFEKVGKAGELKFIPAFNINFYTYDGSEFIGRSETNMSMGDLYVKSDGIYTNATFQIFLIPNLIGLATEPNGEIVYNVGDIIPYTTTGNLYAKQSSGATKVSVNLTTLPGWASLSTGSHNITIVARADGYRDSEPSVGVSVTKVIYKIPAGEYCIKYNLISGDIVSNFPNKSKDIIITDFESYNGWGYTGEKSTFNKITTKFFSDGTKELRYEYPTNKYTTVIEVNSSNAITYIYDYRSSVIFSIDVEVDKNTYDLFYAIYEPIKVITSGTYKWVQNVELNFMAQMSLNFKSNGVNYSWFGVDKENSYYRLFYSTSSWGTPTVYDSSGWKSEAYKTFEVLSDCKIGRTPIGQQFMNGKIAKQ